MFTRHVSDFRHIYTIYIRNFRILILVIEKPAPLGYLFCKNKKRGRVLCAKLNYDNNLVHNEKFSCKILYKLIRIFKTSKLKANCKCTSKENTEKKNDYIGTHIIC